MPAKKTKKKGLHLFFDGRTLALGVALGFLAYVLFVFISVVDVAAANKFLPHMRVGDVSIGGMTVEEAEQTVQERVQQLQEAGITLTYSGEQFVIDATLTDPANPEIVVPLVSYAVDETIQGVREELDQMTYAQRARALIFGLTVTPISTVDTEKLRLALSDALSKYETPARDAKFVANNGTLRVEPEAGGQAFDYDAIIDTITAQFSSLAAPSATVELKPDEPTITRAEAEALIPEAQAVIDRAPYTMAFGDKTWKIDADQVKKFISVYHRGREPVANTQNVQGAGDDLAVGFARETFGLYLTELAPEINVDARPAKFEMQNGRVAEFEASRNGVTLNVDKTIAAVNDVLASGESTFTAVVDETEPAVTTANVNSMGITELVGSGTTNFKGSPKNRRFNIGHAAEKLNGILIAPGEEFSLVKALSPIDTANGYLPELVIKGNRTIPEVGGGLCQIGTTFFRLVLNSGLPIIERKNHSYRVSYYEPPVGMDATIYDPKPDFRFRNDYASYLLLQTRVEGDNLTFEFYGTKDGRIASTTDPKIYNVVKPGPTKIIETTDLKPGERKCIEKAHNGSDAEFTYSVAYVDGRKESEVFKSHYRPWQEVCLVGVTEVSPDTQGTELGNVKTE